MRLFSSLFVLVIARAAIAQGFVFPATPPTYPQEVSRRPLTLPEGFGQITLSGEYDHLARCPYYCTSVLNLGALQAAVDFGLGDRVQLGGAFLYSLNVQDGGSHAAAVAISFLVHHDEELQLALSAGTAVLFSGTPSLAPTAAFGGRYLLDRIFFESNVTATLLTRDTASMAMALDATFGWQASSGAALRLGTTLATLTTRGSATVGGLVGASSVPLHASLTLSPSSAFDVIFSGSVEAGQANLPLEYVLLGALQARVF